MMFYLGRLFGILLGFWAFLCGAEAAQLCDFRGANCCSCQDLAKAVERKDPNEGGYLSGAQWNGLYSAYALNCPSIFEGLLKRGADPNTGGIEGSMIYTISSQFQFYQRNSRHGCTRADGRKGLVRSKPLSDSDFTLFARILAKYGADATANISATDKTADEIESKLKLTAV